MSTHFNQTNSPLPLDGGRVLAPGEHADLAGELTDHDQALVDEGKLVEIGQPVRDELEALKRSELDQRAKGIGVADPEKLPNKAAVVAAIREQETPPVPDAGGGEHDDHPTTEKEA